jgi:hypothetical protein
MNQERFDELTKVLAAGKYSRGKALKMLGAALVGAVLASGRGAALADTQCKPLLKKCNKNAQCCSGNCIENPQGSGKVCGCAAGQTLCPANNSCIQDCSPGEALDPTTCRCTQCQNASDCPTPDNECQRATCTNGVCGVENVPNGTSCDDLNSCTTNDMCAAGVCAGTLREGCLRCQADPDCAEVPVDQCHQAVCGTQGFCIVENRPDGTNCDDGNPCTEGDVCTAGVCAGTQIGDCVQCQNDGDCSGIGVDNQCHEAVCAQAGVCVTQNRADGTPCNDAHACTENEVCIAGVCGGCVTVDNSNPESPPSPCEDPCASQAVSDEANQDFYYAALLDYLTNEGFALDRGPHLVVFQEDGSMLLSSTFLNPTRPDEAAALHYYVPATGDAATLALVVDEQQQTLLYTLAVDDDGQVQQVTSSSPASQTSQGSTVSITAKACDPAQLFACRQTAAWKAAVRVTASCGWLCWAGGIVNPLCAICLLGNLEIYRLELLACFQAHACSEGPCCGGICCEGFTTEGLELSCCSDECVDTGINPLHCGGCGIECGECAECEQEHCFSLGTPCGNTCCNDDETCCDGQCLAACPCPPTWRNCGTATTPICVPTCSTPAQDGRTGFEHCSPITCCDRSCGCLAGRGPICLELCGHLPPGC